MASVVDICNLALSFLGDAGRVSAIDPPDGSVQAERCKRFYPIARQTLLERHDWRFATKRQTIAAQLVTTELPEEWSYAFARPSECLRIIHILPVGAVGSHQATSYDAGALLDGTQVIFSNEESIDVLAVFDVTDTSKYSGLFTAALARLLAHYLAGSSVKGAPGVRLGLDLLKLFTSFDFPTAVAADTSERREELWKDFIPSSLEARR